jgi:superfamily II DNA or RNA helicase
MAHASLAELARWARSQPTVAYNLDAPFKEGLQTIPLSLAAEQRLAQLRLALGVRTLRQVMEHGAADRTLLALAGAHGTREVIASLGHVLEEIVDLDDDDDVDDDVDDDEDDFLDAGLREMERIGARAHPQVGAFIESPPDDVPGIVRWAEEHGVAERLADSVKVLSSAVYSGDPYSREILEGTGRIADALAPQAGRPATLKRRLGNYERAVRRQSDEAIRRAALQYLHVVATIRAEVIAGRKAGLAAPPVDPPLAKLHGLLQAARAALVPRVRERPLGTYRPQPAKVATEPLRITYMESADFRWGFHQASVVIEVDAEPMRIRCLCSATQAEPSCAHALSAIDAAIDLLCAPSSARDQLASIYGTPMWARFLRTFGDELTRRATTVREDERLAWRIAGEGSRVELEPVLQKRVKGGGFSPGQRLRLEDLARQRPAYTDPRDERAVTALTAGFEEAHAWPSAPISGKRLARALEALSGHPLVFMEGRPAVPVRIANARLAVSLEPRDGGLRPSNPQLSDRLPADPEPHDGAASSGEVSVAFFVGDKRFEAPELAALAGAAGDLIVADRAAGTVALCTLDGKARALVEAFAKHPAWFPPEIHDELLRSFGALQQSVDLKLDEALAGTRVEGDARPVVRLAMRETGDVEVEIVVRPVPGGPVFPPGEGAATVLHSIEGSRVSARRDLPAEVAYATALTSGIAETGGPWRFVLDEEAALGLLSTLRAQHAGVEVEWLEPDKRLVLAGTAKAKELRVRVTDRRDWFGVDGEVEIDGDAVSLAVLLDAVRSGRRFVRVGAGKFAAIEEDLRRRVAQAGDVLHAGKKGLEVALPGAALLEGLVAEPRMLEAASRFRNLVRRLDAAKDLDPALPAGLTAELRPYQLEGYKWLMRLASWGAGACLADDMGLGKTVQTLALLLERAGRGPALVVAPTSVGQNWIDEAARFAPSLRARLYRGSERARVLAEARPGDLLVTSYAVLVRDVEALAGARFASLVLDEAQAFKNALTRRARAVGSLDAELRVALTGTPVENHLGDLWSLMRVITPGLLGSWEHFRDRFATAIERGKDPERSAALARVLRPFLLRRTKAEVAPDLPPRTEIQRMVTPSVAERALYDAARTAAIEAMAAGAGDGGDARFALFAALTRLRRLACHPRLHDDASTVPSSKLAAFLDIVEELREGGHRALVFSQFTTHLALVREALDRRRIRYDYLDGSTPAEDRARRVATFQAGDADLFLISLKAGGSGLNLTGADYVIHLDPWWNPAVEDQATDRAHRIGQTRAVTVIRLVTKGTIEEAVLALHGEKRALAASVFDESGSPARLSTAELADLIRSGVDEAALDDDADASGDDEVATSDARKAQPPRGEAPRGEAPRGEAPRAEGPPVDAAKRQEPPPRSARALDDLVPRVIAYLAAQRGDIDPRYDTTLRTYERGLRRFVEYLATRAKTGAAVDMESAIDDFLAAVDDGTWPVPPSQLGLMRTVTNHVRAYLRSAKARA